MQYNKNYAVHEFFLKKVCTHKTVEAAERSERNLSLLQQDDFRRIKIPTFSFKRKDNVITIDIDYIKGDQIHPANFEAYKQVVLEDIVLRVGEFDKNNYSFTDYSFSNFIVCRNTLDLYVVDLESYEPSTLEDRVLRYSKYGWNGSIRKESFYKY